MADRKIRKRSIALIIATILATAYTVYLIVYFTGSIASADGAAEALGGVIASSLVAPHAIVFLIGALFGWVGVLAKANWAALTAAILYAVAAVLFILYFMFSLPILILGFIGYANQRKINIKLLQPKA